MPFLRSTPLKRLGDIPIATFLSDHWQRQPLVVRAAVDPATFSLTPAAHFRLACREGIEARVIRQVRGARKARWLLDHGPFEATDYAALRAEEGNTPWTLLVQDVNHYRDDAAALLRQFAFVPQARLDDVMVSLASDGGGVGPHVDSYDVFLIQLRGQRRWRIQRHPDPAVLPDAPVKLLARFEPEEEWLLNPGDLLYLPPGVAHDGVAVGACMTASVGFRVPTQDEVRLALLDHMARSGSHDQPTAFADRQATWGASATIPGDLDGYLRTEFAQVLEGLPSLDECIGSILTQPKPGVTFAARRASPADKPRALAEGLHLDRKSRMLIHGDMVYLNGRRLAAVTPCLRQLAENHYVRRCDQRSAVVLLAALERGEVCLNDVA
jgi:50S ribosomal protein L16 3-hydroxylase